MKQRWTGTLPRRALISPAVPATSSDVSLIPEDKAALTLLLACSFF